MIKFLQDKIQKKKKKEKKQQKRKTERKKGERILAVIACGNTISDTNCPTAGLKYVG